MLQSILPSLELKNCREEKLWQFLYHLVLDSTSAFRLRPKTHMRSAVLCRSLNISIWFRFDWNVQHYFVSIRKTFIDIFVALTEQQKKLLHTFYHKKTQKILFSHEKPHKIFFAQNNNSKFYLHVAWVFSNCQLLDAEMERFCCCCCCRKNVNITEHAVITL